jgi:hypothetical protein
MELWLLTRGDHIVGDLFNNPVLPLSYHPFKSLLDQGERTRGAHLGERFFNRFLQVRKAFGCRGGRQLSLTGGAHLFFSGC